MATYYLQRGPVTPSAFFPRIDCTSAAAAGGGTRVIGNGLPYSSSSVYPYFESNIVGSINFPMGVGYVLAPFLSYWGSKLGLQLQVVSCREKYVFNFLANRFPSLMIFISLLCLFDSAYLSCLLLSIPLAQVVIFSQNTRSLLSSCNVLFLIPLLAHILILSPTNALTHTLTHPQEWCKRWGFPLFWAPCAVSSRYSCALETSHPRQAWRVLDPGVANTSRLNVTVMAGMTDVSARLWSAVETLPVNVSKQVRAIM